MVENCYSGSATEILISYDMREFDNIKTHKKRNELMQWLYKELFNIDTKADAWKKSQNEMKNLVLVFYLVAQREFW